MVKSQCLRDVENLARMTEQHRKNLEVLWLKLAEVQAAIQSSKNAKEVGRLNRVTVLN